MSPIVVLANDFVHNDSNYINHIKNLFFIDIVLYRFM